MLKSLSLGISNSHWVNGHIYHFMVANDLLGARFNLSLAVHACGGDDSAVVTDCPKNRAS
jgi:hypothetical protein